MRFPVGRQLSVRLSPLPPPSFTSSRDAEEPVWLAVIEPGMPRPLAFLLVRPVPERSHVRLRCWPSCDRVRYAFPAGFAGGTGAALHWRGDFPGFRRRIDGCLFRPEVPGWGGHWRRTLAEVRAPWRDRASRSMAGGGSRTGRARWPPRAPGPAGWHGGRPGWCAGPVGCGCRSAAHRSGRKRPAG